MNRFSVSNHGPNSRATAAGGLIASLLASSCCLGPLLLVSIGVSGAWIGNLAALEAYKSFFVLIGIVLLASGFWQVYIRPKRVFPDGEVCVPVLTDYMVKLALWIATILILLAISIGYWAPVFY
ncbi:MAG: mercury transporter MerT [Xanthomonadales bacterium]|nr:mercury transporter MerT [Xanthomonadales bacterium]